MRTRNKVLLIAGLMFAAVFTVKADTVTPSVDNVTMAQNSDSRTVTVTYTLSDAPAIITLDVLTNGVSIGQENVWSLAGDVNMVVQNGSDTKKITWHPDKSWPDQKFGAGVVSAKVTAWAVNDPPMYLAVNLLQTGDVKYYTCAEAVPGGVTNNIYKTGSILMRRIYARGIPWLMGSAGNEIGHMAREMQHEVTLTNDYYVGVYELTQKQWYYVTGESNRAFFNNAADWAERPIENVAFAMVRLNDYNNSAVQTAYAYPADPYSGSFLGLLRTKSGGLKFDMPSVAQWEYACRAGNGDGKWGDGSLILASEAEDTNLNGLGRYKRNGGSNGTQGVAAADGGTSKVGTCRSNDWGLYDMHGNVYEFCLDGWDASNGYGAGVLISRMCIRKGASYADDPFACRSAFYTSADLNICYPACGVRLAITLP